MGDELRSEAIASLNKLFECGHDGHGTDHALRVYDNAMAIAGDEKCDREVVALAALLHDADDHKIFETKNNENARNFLSARGVNGSKAERIIEAINSVSFSKNKGKRPKTIEGRIVQDADRLDALGAVGIARTFAYGGSRGRSIESSVAHFHEKLILLKDLMNTESARRLAEERHKFLLTFLREWERETGTPSGDACRLPETNLDEAIAELKRRERDVLKYAWIMKKFAEGDCGEEFRKRYCGFYRVRRDAAWRNSYFCLMEKFRKRKGVSFGEILRALHKETGQVEASFASKMLATLDDRMPIWDSRVLAALSIKSGGKTAEEKMDNAIRRYDRITKWYVDFQNSERATGMIREFDEAFPGLRGISVVKKIDFLLWAGQGKSENGWFMDGGE